MVEGLVVVQIFGELSGKFRLTIRRCRHKVLFGASVPGLCGAFGISGCLSRTNSQVCVLSGPKWTRQLAASCVRLCRRVSITVLLVPIFQATRCVSLSTW